MNIFILDEDLDKCAEYHVDKHIVKMPLEAGQMLCTVDTEICRIQTKQKTHIRRMGKSLDSKKE